MVSKCSKRGLYDDEDIGQMKTMSFTNAQKFTCYTSFQHTCIIHLCVHNTPTTSLFKNAEFLSWALGWFMWYIRQSVVRATNSLAFIAVVLYYFLRVIYQLPSGAYPPRTAFRFQGHHGGHPMWRTQIVLYRPSAPRSPPSDYMPFALTLI